MNYEYSLIEYLWVFILFAHKLVLFDTVIIRLCPILVTQQHTVTHPLDQTRRRSATMTNDCAEKVKVKSKKRKLAEAEEDKQYSNRYSVFNSNGSWKGDAFLETHQQRKWVFSPKDFSTSKGPFFSSPSFFVCVCAWLKFEFLNSWILCLLCVFCFVVVWILFLIAFTLFVCAPFLCVIWVGLF